MELRLCRGSTTRRLWRFFLADPLPPGLEYVGCLTTGEYNCVNNAGTIGIDKTSGASGVNLGEGESAEAFITVRLSSDPADFPGGVCPTDLANTATITSGDSPINASTTTPVNPPENNWKIGKSAIIPSPPLNPALDNNAIYRIEMCPDGPAGIGIGTIPLSKVWRSKWITHCRASALFFR